ncbi:MAG: DUF2330 domain-containing protein [Minicystis sp.]
MRPSKWLLASIPLFALLFAAQPPRARACGACFHGEGENTQVTGHRMIFSISQARTTLWDQISYTGDPSSFAWVLPVKGSVEIGLSSDALFASLDQATQVAVEPPPLQCPDPPECWYDENIGGYGGEGGASGGEGGGGGGGVEIVAESVVGPYETVTLHSTDPNALANWLSSHGYVIQSDFAPVVSAYVQEGFDFVALKLVPGKGVTAMRPVRITTDGAGVALPLRMVAGGTGVTTPITLWVMGNGRYETKSTPTFTISEDQLVWDFATSSSNYSMLRKEGLADGSWLAETSSPIPTGVISGPIDDTIFYDPVSSGYGDANGLHAAEEADADYDKLWGTLPSQPWLTRLRAELPRSALSTDLVLGASSDQTAVPGNLTAANGINVPPCPTYTCSDGTTYSGSSGGTIGDGGGSGHGCSGGCTVGSESDSIGGLQPVHHRARAAVAAAQADALSHRAVLG